jgi:hypothetical protein
MLKPYFECEGPFGLPMRDKQARALEERLKSLPKDDAFALRRCAVERGVTEVLPEGRAEVSWITAEAPDRVGDVVLAAGMDDSHYQLNPIVTLNHSYDEPPVGRSLWRRKLREGSLAGVKAKTVYPPRPGRWDGDWPPERAFELIQAGLLRGKSIGFFPLKLRPPTAEEIERRPGYKSVRFVIEEWLLAEYACCVLPMQPHAVVTEVCGTTELDPRDSRRSTRGLGVQLTSSDSGVSTAAPARVSFLTLGEIAKSLPGRLLSEDLEKSVEKALLRSWEKTRGRV